MIIAANGLGPPFREVDKILGKFGVAVQHLDHSVVSHDGTPVPTMRLFRAKDGKSHTIQPLLDDQKVTHELLLDWCDFFSIDSHKAFGIVRAK